MYAIRPKHFIAYKFFNSLFLGLSIGALVVVYQPIELKTFSLGGILLALGMLLTAQLYPYILNTAWFFRINLFVEIVIFLAILYLLIRGIDVRSALVVYIAYQLTFVFGSYLLRIETLLLKKSLLLKYIDTAKQLGYLVGMGGAYLLYDMFESYDITSKTQQVIYLHYLLSVLQFIIIYVLYTSFKHEVKK